MAEEQDNKKLDKVIVAMVAALFIAPIASSVVQKKVDNKVKQYVGNNLNNIMKEQEEKLGIKHFGVPIISYDPKSANEFGGLAQGVYTPEEDEIFLQLGLAVTPEENLTNTLANIFNGGYTHNIKIALDHELGHYYMDKLNENVGNGDWPTQMDLFTNPGTKVIAEGVAEYFNATINNKEDIYDKWPETIFDWTPVDVYDGGCHLVKPIIDKYGQKGIEHLMENPPTLKDFDNIQGYQNRILENLANPMAEQEPYEEQEIQAAKE